MKDKTRLVELGAKLYIIWETKWNLQEENSNGCQSVANQAIPKDCKLQ